MVRHSTVRNAGGKVITQLSFFSAFPVGRTSGKFPQPINLMKIIFSAPNLIEVSELKDMLDAAGIACFINNEASSRLAGGIPMSETMPELWIEDDARLAEAEQIKRDWQSPPPAAGAAWTC